MSVTGNAFEMHEKVECYVCGRPGFMRFDEGPRVLHAYTPPCTLFRPPPPKPPKPKTARDRIAEIQARAA